MRVAILFILYLAASFTAIAGHRSAEAAVAIENMKCEGQNSPSGVEESRPRLSWQLKSSIRNVLQQSYRILVSDDAERLNRNEGNIWDSKRVVSSASLQVPFGGKILKATKTYYWKLMVWDNFGNQSGWSAVQEWQMGLLTKSDWHNANWIAYDEMPDSARILPSHLGKRDRSGGSLNDVLPLLRKDIWVNKQITKATVFMAGLGHFELHINGKKIGDHLLDAGWTNYEKEALYVPFDVTAALKNGENTIGVMLGNGFHFIPRQKRRYKKLLVQYGYPKMIFRMLINYSDGTSANVISDQSWKTTAGPIIFSSIYGGEDYDATKESTGWDNTGFVDKNWKTPIIVKGPQILHAQTTPPIKTFEEFSPKQITAVGPATWVYDLGQNASGIVRIAVQGKKGDTLKITPAELLNPNGTVNQKASGSPFYFTYILKGTGTEIWEPRFSYYGFRYVQITGAIPDGKTADTGLPIIKNVLGLHLRGSAEQAGTFHCSSELFNRTADLIDWGIRSNMMSVLTDCPHREKLGWLEQVHLMGSSLRYGYQVQRLLEKSVSDMKLAQAPNGLVPEIAPEYTVFTWGGDMFRDSPEWGSSSIIVPWYSYQWYGDERQLARAYPMMRRYADYLLAKSKNNLLSQGLGDWYDLGPNPPGVSQLTTMGLTATAIWHEDLNILQQTALKLGKTGEAQRYHDQAEKVKSAFNARFFNIETKSYATGSQTANAMALYMKLVPAQYKDAVVNNLVAAIRQNQNMLTSGDIGYRYLLRVLEEEGRSDVIFDMNNRKDVAGYGYQLEQGATALTESWQALPSVSNNHLMLGHLMEWFYSGIGGIRQEENGVAFKKIMICPEMVEGLSEAQTSYDSPYGRIATSWKKGPNGLSLTVDIPANTSAKIYIPVAGIQEIREGGKVLGERLTISGYKDGRAIIAAGSGNYQLTVQ